MPPLPPITVFAVSSLPCGQCTARRVAAGLAHRSNLLWPPTACSRLEHEQAEKRKKYETALSEENARLVQQRMESLKHAEQFEKRQKQIQEMKQRTKFDLHAKARMREDRFKRAQSKRQAARGFGRFDRAHPLNWGSSPLITRPLPAFRRARPVAPVHWGPRLKTHSVGPWNALLLLSHARRRRSGRRCRRSG